MGKPTEPDWSRKHEKMLKIGAPSWKILERRIQVKRNGVIGQAISCYRL
jgi:hypothetical protein